MTQRAVITRSAVSRRRLCPVLLFLLLWVATSAGRLFSANGGEVKVSVLNFAGAGEGDMSAAVMRNAVEHSLFRSGGLVILERSRLDLVNRRRAVFYARGNIGEAASAGRILNADYVIVGTFENTSPLRLTLSIVDVAQSAYVYREEVSADDLPGLRSETLDAGLRLASRLRKRDFEVVDAMPSVELIAAYSLPHGMLAGLSSRGLAVSASAGFEDVLFRGLIVGGRLDYVIFQAPADRMETAYTAGCSLFAGLSFDYGRFSYGVQAGAGLSYACLFYYTEEDTEDTSRRSGTEPSFFAGIRGGYSLYENLRLNAVYELCGIVERKGNVYYSRMGLSVARSFR